MGTGQQAGPTASKSWPHTPASPAPRTPTVPAASRAAAFTAFPTGTRPGATTRAWGPSLAVIGRRAVFARGLTLLCPNLPLPPRKCPLLDDLVDDLLAGKWRDTLFQDTVAPAAYWKDPFKYVLLLKVTGCRSLRAGFSSPPPAPNACRQLGCTDDPFTLSFSPPSLTDYLKYNTFLPIINNEREEKNETVRRNMLSLNRFATGLASKDDVRGSRAATDACQSRPPADTLLYRWDNR